MFHSVAQPVLTPLRWPHNQLKPSFTQEARPAGDDALPATAVTTVIHPASPTRGVVWSLDQGSVVRTAIASLQAAQVQHPLASVSPIITSPRGGANPEAGPSPFSRVAARIRAIESTPSYGASPSVRSPRLSLPDFLRAHEPGSGQGLSLFSDPGDRSTSPRAKAVAQLHVSQDHAVPAAAVAGGSLGLKQTPSDPEACVSFDGMGLVSTLRPAAATAPAYFHQKNATGVTDDVFSAPAAADNYATASIHVSATASDSVPMSDQPDLIKMAVAADDVTKTATITGVLEPGAGGVALAGADDVMVVVDRVLEEIVDYINAVGAETAVAFGFGTVTADVSDDDAARQPGAGEMAPETDMLRGATGSEEEVGGWQ